jgi:hypothetical protein
LGFEFPETRPDRVSEETVEFVSARAVVAAAKAADQRLAESRQIEFEHEFLGIPRPSFDL